MKELKQSSLSAVRLFQFSLLGAFVIFAASVIGWIVHLVRLSITLDDVPDASMAISLVAIPVFVILAGIVSYVILGLVLDPEAREARSKGDDS